MLCLSRMIVLLDYRETFQLWCIQVACRLFDDFCSHPYFLLLLRSVSGLRFRPYYPRMMLTLIYLASVLSIIVISNSALGHHDNAVNGTLRSNRREPVSVPFSPMRIVLWVHQMYDLTLLLGGTGSANFHLAGKTLDKKKMGGGISKSAQRYSKGT